MNTKAVVFLAALLVVITSGCISYPQRGVVNDTVSINGTAYARNFSSYILEIGETFNPTNWSSIGINLTGGGLAIINQSDLGFWDTRNYPDGDYTIKLSVRDTNNISSADYVYLSVNNLYISDPAYNSFHRFGDVIEVKGKIVNNFFSNYTIQHSPSGSENWSTEGVTLANNGTIAVNNGTLGFWNTSAVSRSGLHDIKLIVNYTTGKSNTESDSVILDSYQPGWPIELLGWIFSSPTLADVDGNGTQEVIVGDFMSYLYIFRSDGTDFSGEFPRALIGDLFYTSASVADLARDGHVSVVFATDAGRLYALPTDGSLGWLQKLNASGSTYQIESTPVIADFDGDGNFEVFAADDYGYVYMFRHNGTPLDGWPVYAGTGYTISDTPTIADINNDGLPEIVLIDNGGYLYAFNLSGQMISQTWPIRLDSYTMYESSPVSGDLDGDDIPEIVWADYNSRVHAINGDGSNVSGWPINIYPSFVDYSTPALADLNNNGKLEVVVASYDGLIFVINSSGSILPGWPVNLSDSFQSSPVIGDIDGDGSMEIIVGSTSGWLYALNENGSNVSGWPKYVYDEIYFAPAIGDLEGDGDTEVVACGRYNSLVFVWDTNAPYNASSVPWSMFMRDAQHTGAVPLPSPEVTLLSPADNAITHPGILTFSYSVSSNVSIANCSLYTNVSGAWSINQTNTNIVQGTNNFTLNISTNGTFRWNVKCTNTAKRFGFASKNWVFTISSDPAYMPPVFSSVSAENITGESAVLKWGTETPTNATVQYGTTRNYSTTLSVNETALNHTLALSGLPENTRIYYKINASNNLSLTTPYEGNFSTALVFRSTFNASANETVVVNDSATNLSVSILPNTSVTNATITILRFSENPTGVPFAIPGLNIFFQIEASSELASSLSSTLFSFHYTDAELNASGLNESSLVFYHFNETEREWQKLNASAMPWVLATGVNAEENLVWVNVTHFSIYTVGGTSIFETTTLPIRIGWNLISISLIT